MEMPFFVFQSRSGRYIDGWP